ncbi:MAG: DinB family protein [Planctomycetes bacterium]|nr:DinB family protein [Planctomycetota bacterium]
MNLGAALAPSLRMTLGYADELVRTIPAERFSHMPAADINSPAFCIGHLSIYAARAGEAMGVKIVPAPSGWMDLFKNGAPCVDRAGHYPAKDELVAEFSRGWSEVAEALPAVSDAVFAAPNPVASLAQRLPTTGALLAFLCLAHNMVHLGQISAWRRVVGLGSAM